MPNPIILSDEDDDYQNTPLLSFSKKPRIADPSAPTIILIDDDPTPKKPGGGPHTPVFVPETPLSAGPSLVKCTTAAAVADSIPQFRVSDIIDQKISGDDGLICLESENDEPEDGFRKESWMENDITGVGDGEVEDSSLGDSILIHMAEDGSSKPTFSEDDLDKVHEHSDKENFSMEQMRDCAKNKRRNKVNSDMKNSTCEVGKKKMTKEERTRLMEEKKLKKQQEKLQKEALKAQAAELKKMEKEKQKWEKGKFALKSIVAEIDTKVVEQGSVGGHLLTRFAEKGLSYRITSNPIERSIVWTMSVPENISQLSPEGTEIRYILLAYEAEEFCNLVINESLLGHVCRVQSHYPSYTVCYLTNRLMAYVIKREKEQYKNPENDNGWRRPPVEEVLAKLTTHFTRVHHRQCTDEAELAEHVVGLTCSLASCQFRKKLTRLSVNANGSLIPKDSADKNLIKKSPWLKALVAIPKVQPRFAVAIWKKYPTMKSLLTVYMDPGKSVHEKEFLLEDLVTEGLLGGDRRVGQVCSKRVYRILMAQSGSIKTDDVEDGADFFRHQST